MKQPKKLTREQKTAVSAAGLNAENWMLVVSKNHPQDIRENEKD